MTKYSKRHDRDIKSSLVQIKRFELRFYLKSIKALFLFYFFVAGQVRWIYEIFNPWGEKSTPAKEYLLTHKRLPAHIGRVSRELLYV